jgi:RND superfamily putative drug exporter
VPPSTPIRVAERAIDRAFPGESDTADLVIMGHRLGQPRTVSELRAIGRRGAAITGGHGSVALQVSRDGNTAQLQIPMPNSSLSTADRRVSELRSQLEPAVARAIPGARADLTGDYAGSLDFSTRLSNVTPFVIAFVLALAFVLLVATFGSPLLALSVIGLNLLSVAAAFGVLVAVFQYGWGQSLLGFRSDGAIVDWLPLFAFVVLFGLSMDYTVLMLERAREARRRGASAKQAAAEALGSTGGTVTSAAVVMIAVFSVFATLELLEFKQMGVGLAAAIALDATIVRGVALPAALTLLGDRGLAPARRRRKETLDWDHATHAPALGSSHD